MVLPGHWRMTGIADERGAGFGTREQ